MDDTVLITTRTPHAWQAQKTLPVLQKAFASSPSCWRRSGSHGHRNPARQKRARCPAPPPASLKSPMRTTLVIAFVPAVGTIEYDCNGHGHDGHHHHLTVTTTSSTTQPSPWR